MGRIRRHGGGRRRQVCSQAESCEYRSRVQPQIHGRAWGRLCCGAPDARPSGETVWHQKQIGKLPYGNRHIAMLLSLHLIILEDRNLRKCLTSFRGECGVGGGQGMKCIGAERAGRGEGGDREQAHKNYPVDAMLPWWGFDQRRDEPSIRRARLARPLAIPAAEHTPAFSGAGAPPLTGVATRLRPPGRCPVR